jgi:hypothetical protein
MFTNSMGIGMAPGSGDIKNDTIKFLIANKGTAVNANIAWTIHQLLGSPIEEVTT